MLSATAGVSFVMDKRNEVTKTVNLLGDCMLTKVQLLFIYILDVVINAAIECFRDTAKKEKKNQGRISEGYERIDQESSEIFY